MKREKNELFKNEKRKELEERSTEDT